MISRCGLMTKKDGMSKTEFQEYWLNVHGPIAAKMTHMRQYDQHVFSPIDFDGGIPQGPVIIDGYSELQFDSYGDMLEGVESLHGEGAGDVPLFAAPYNPIIVMVKRPIAKVPEYLSSRNLIKVVAYLGRAAGISHERFLHEWWNVFSHESAAIPGFVGYNQNIVIDRINAGSPLSYDELPIDGVVELWFESVEAFDEFKSSPEYARAAKHARAFVGALNAYFSETHSVELPTA